MLEARNIRKSYHSEGIDVDVLRGVGLQVEPGEFISIVGRSGSGKTTFLNVISTLLAPDSGEILYEGRDIAHLDEKELNALRRKDFAVVFQFHHLLPYLTAEENILLPFMGGMAPVTSKIRKRALACLERVGLSGKADKLPGQLSGGEQQRVAIARALVKDARILFADEPTGNLDKATGDSIVELLRGMKAEGLSVVMVTHDRAYAGRADRMLEMTDGSLALS